MQKHTDKQELALYKQTVLQLIPSFIGGFEDVLKSHGVTVDEGDDITQYYKLDFYVKKYNEIKTLPDYALEDLINRLTVELIKTYEEDNFYSWISWLILYIPVIALCNIRDIDLALQDSIGKLDEAFEYNGPAFNSNNSNEEQ